MVLLRVWESHEQACDCGVGLMLSSTSIDYWLGRTRAVLADLYRREGEASKAKEILSKAIEIIKECGAGGWEAKYEKELAEL